ncbi:hypothetical protein CMV16_18540 [Peribacillus simplex]|nr:hypothetical protein CMV16_18540 [Peribacillus simplex]
MKDYQVFFKIMVQNETISNHDFKTKLIGTEGTRLLREKRVEGRPRRRAPRRLPDRPRKASAWSGNQQVDGGNFTELDGPKIGCSFIIEGKGFTNIFTQ